MSTPTTLREQIAHLEQAFGLSAEDKAAFDAGVAEIVEANVSARALKVGDPMPDFTLPDSEGRALAARKLLEHGPLVLSFYRGAWCPYCSEELRALQSVLPEIDDLGGQLLAISPQLPDDSLTGPERRALVFSILTDHNNVVAKQFGLAFRVPERAVAQAKARGVDLSALNGTDTDELPVPGTFVVDTQGVIRFAYAEADYRKRAEPQAVVECLRAL